MKRAIRFRVPSKQVTSEFQKDGFTLIEVCMNECKEFVELLDRLNTELKPGEEYVMTLTLDKPNTK